MTTHSRPWLATRPHSSSHLRKLWMAAPFAAVAVGWLMLRNPWISVALFHGSMLAALIWHRAAWKPSLLFRGGHLIWLFPIVMLVGMFAWWLFRRLERNVDLLEAALIDFGLQGPMVWLLAVYFCLCNPALEEGFWRGLHGTSSRMISFSDMAYGAFHTLIVLPFLTLTEAAVVAGFLVIMGNVWRQITIATGGQRIAVIWHALGDIAVIGVVAFVATTD
jgi:hypothetical protein